MNKIKKRVKSKVSEMGDEYFYVPKDRDTVATTSLACRLNVWFYGPSGTGKSEYAVRLCHKTDREYTRINCSGESGVDDLLGHYTLRDKETVWIDGALIDAVRNGKVLIVDEIDVAPPEINIALQRALEVQQRGGKHTLQSQRGAQTVDIHPAFSVIVTGNTKGAGEQGMLYVGTRIQNAAFRDRFVYVKVDYAPLAEEAKIVEYRCKVDKRFAMQIAQFGEVLRKSMEGSASNDVVSTRSMIVLGKLTKGLERAGQTHDQSLRWALQAVVLEKLSVKHAEVAASELVQRVFDIKLGD